MRTTSANERYFFQEVAKVESAKAQKTAKTAKTARTAKAQETTTEPEYSNTFGVIITLIIMALFIGFLFWGHAI